MLALFDSRLKIMSQCGVSAALHTATANTKKAIHRFSLFTTTVEPNMYGKFTWRH